MKDYGLRRLWFYFFGPRIPAWEDILYNLLRIWIRLNAVHQMFTLAHRSIARTTSFNDQGGPRKWRIRRASSRSKWNETSDQRPASLVTPARAATHTHEYGRIFGSGPGRQSVMALRKHTYKRHEPNCPATTVSLRRLTANCRRMVPLASDENKRSLPNCSGALKKEALERACHQTTHPPHLSAKFLCLDRQLTASERARTPHCVTSHLLLLEDL